MTKKEQKSDTWIVTVDDDDEIQVFNKIEMDKYRADKAEIDPKTGSKQTPDKHFKIGENLVEPKYNPMDLVALLDIYSYHEACVDAVATDAAGINYTLDPVEGVEPVEAQKEVLTSILDESTPSINIHLKRTAYDRRTLGYGAVEVIRKSTSKSPIRRFKHIPAHILRRHSDMKRVLYMDVTGKRVWYVIYGKNYDDTGNLCDVHADTGQFYPYNSLAPEEKANELLWTMEYAPGTNYYGRPPVIATIPSIESDLSAVKYNSSFFKNMGMPKFAVTVTGDFKDYDEPPYITDSNGNTLPNPHYDEKQTLRWQISQQIKQIIKHPHSALCVTIPSQSEESNVELKIIPLSVQTEEGHFRMFRKDIRDEVIHAHKVDPSRLAIFDTGNLNGTNSENTKTAYQYGTVAPVKSELEAMINQVLPELRVNTWRFSIVDVNPVDLTKSKDLAQFLFQSAAMTPMDLINVYGAEFGLSPKDPDDYYLNSYYLNGVPLEQIWNNTENNPFLEKDSIIDEIYDAFTGGADNGDKQVDERGNAGTGDPSTEQE